jgi:hypothetical protein
VFPCIFSTNGEHFTLLTEVVSGFKSFSEAPRLTQKCSTHWSDSPAAPERTSWVEAENATALASTHEDAEGFVRKIALLEDELAVGHQAREVSERERGSQFKELSLFADPGF